MTTIVVVRVEGEPFRFSCKMSLEDEDQLRAVLVDKTPHNIEIRATDLWLLCTVPNGSQILIKTKEHHEMD